MSLSKTSILSSTDIFYGMTDAQLNAVAEVCEQAAYNNGEIVVEEQEHSDELYVIASGALEIIMDPAVVSPEAEEAEPMAIAEMLPRQVVGEIALVDQGIRSATVRACKEDTTVLRIPRESLMRVCEAHPELGFKLMRNLAGDLALKIRNANLNLRQYKLMMSK